MKTTVSKYLAIADTLRKDILSGRYDDAGRFPSEEALVRKFHVSRPTVERALRELKREGFLDARPGSGFFLTSFAKNAAGSIAVIAPDYRHIDFFTDLCDSISDVGRAAGYEVTLCDDPVGDDRAAWALAAAKACTQRKTAGVLLEPIDLMPDSVSSTESVLRLLARHSIPVVLLDRDHLPAPRRSAYDLIGIDNVLAGYRIARHLIEAGAKTIHFLTQPDYASTIRSRILGVSQAAFDSDMEWSKKNIIEVDPEDPEKFRKAILRILAPARAPAASCKKRQAFVCRNDALAARLIQIITAAGRSIPGHVMVAGFDDGKIAKLLNPPLTTISQPVKLLAETAVASLLQRIRTPDLAPRSILLDAPLTVRSSTAAV